MNYLNFNQTEWILLAAVLLYLILLHLASWMLFKKAGKPGWAALIPIYNFSELLEIVGKPSWWLLLLLIPGVNFIVFVIVVHHLALCFGKDILFTVGLILFGYIFFPMLAFGKATYRGPLRTA
ncbi:MAG: hypothetical protein RL160_2088 [Bacteroidota bacterium]|jgi:hypothetical protein